MDNNKSSQADHGTCPARKKYLAPKITTYGNIREITQALSGNISDKTGVAGKTSA